MELQYRARGYQLKITNRHKLPQAYVRAVTNDPYSKGESDFSVTGLLAPPRQRVLIQKHSEILEEDAKDRVWALLGQATHAILERSAREGDLVEKRFFAKFSGKVLSGQIDLLEHDTLTLSDWKVTKAWAFSKKGGSGKKPEWVQQLNMQLELLRQNGLDAKALNIVGILKDFDSKKAGENGYPIAEIVCADIPIWPREKTQAFIVDRIRLHTEAETILPQCSPSDTWGGNRCKSYCSASAVCEQYKLMRKTGLHTTQGEVKNEVS